MKGQGVSHAWRMLPRCQEMSHQHLMAGMCSGAVRLLTLIDAPEHNTEEIYIMVRTSFLFFYEVHCILISHLHSSQIRVNLGVQDGCFRNVIK